MGGKESAVPYKPQFGIRTYVPGLKTQHLVPYAEAWPTSVYVFGREYCIFSRVCQRLFFFPLPLIVRFDCVVVVVVVAVVPSWQTSRRVTYVPQLTKETH